MQILKSSFKLYFLLSLCFSLTSSASDFIRGDLNLDGQVTGIDVYYYSLYGVTPPPVCFGALCLSAALPRKIGSPPPQTGCADRADVNDDGVVNLADYNYLQQYIFNNGPAPAEPFVAPGQDPTDDAMKCGMCYVAGNQSGNGYVKILKPGSANPNHYVYGGNLINSPSISRITGLEPYDENTLIILYDSNPDNESKTAYLDLITGAIVPIHTGPLVTGNLTALGGDTEGLAVDKNGLFVAAEKQSSQTGTQVSFFDLAGNVVANINTFGSRPRDVALDSNDQIVFAMDNNGPTTYLYAIDDNFQLIGKCTTQGSFASDMHVDRITGDIYMTQYSNFDPDARQVRYCTADQTSGGSTYLVSAADLGYLPFDNSKKIVAVEQWPSFNDDVLVIVQDSSLANVHTASGSLVLGLTSASDVQDVVCIDN